MTAKGYVRALILSAIIGGGLPSYVWAQDHIEVVRRVRRALTARGIIPAGIVNPGNNENPCGVFEITKRVAWELRAEGAGLLEKRSGNNCNGYSMDWVVYPDGRGADIAVGGEFDGVTTDAAPAWSIEVVEDHGRRWRPALDPEDAPVPTPGTPVPNPGTPPPVIVQPVDLSGLESKIDALARDLAAHEQAEAVFREQARGVWNEFFKPVLGFTGKYIAPAVGAYFFGKEMAQQ